jgi:hypothetical protein
VTHDDLIRSMASAMQSSKAWPAVYKAGTAELLSRVALAVVYETLTEPSKKMCKAAAKAMSPEKRPTPEWMPSSDKHAYRFMAMIEASPLKPVDSGDKPA